MKKISLVTDSTWDRGKDLDNKFGIRVIPLNVHFDDGQYLDGVDLTQDTFLDKLSKSSDLPTTSQPSPLAFEEIFREELDKGNIVLYIGLDGVLSGTHQSATIAKNTINNEDIYLIDSKTVTLGLAILVEIAHKLISEGKDIKEIVETLEELKKRIVIYACVETLKNLQRGGRISATKAVIGGILNMKPILQVKDGVISSFDKARGSKNALSRLVEIAEESNIDTNFPVSFGHVGALESANRLFELCNEKCGITESFVQEIGPVVATHAGPGAYGFACVTK